MVSGTSFICKKKNKDSLKNLIKNIPSGSGIRKKFIQDPDTGSRG
jgi:hypothetical protein